ncbi:MAG: mechanosensitive ion channel [Deltaproteobacteria bacterium]|jgi:small-conductance mechanosensitive channel|nr:mechanosensitive ion channel [Deltaproteobacteria bacterium]
MPVKKVVLASLLLLLFVWNPSLAARPADPAPPDSQPADSQAAGGQATAGAPPATDGPARENVDETLPDASTLLLKEDELTAVALERANNLLETYDAEKTHLAVDPLQTDSSFATMQQDITGLLADFSQLQWTYASFRGHPAEQQDCLSQMETFKTRLAAQIDPLTVQLISIGQYMADLNNSLTILKALKSSRLDVAEAESKLQSEIAVLESSDKIVRDAIDAGSKALATADAAIENISKDVPGLWESYYFKSSGLTGVTQTAADLKYWYRFLPKRLAFMIPVTPEEREVALVYFVVTVTLMLLAGSLILRGQAKIPAEFRALAIKILKGPWIWLTAGLAFLIPGLTSQSGNHGLLVMLGILIVIRTMGELAWRLRLTTNPDLQDDRSPLRRFFIPAAAGVILLFADLPAGLVSVVWPLSMIVFLFYLRRLEARKLAGLSSLPEQIAYGSGVYFAVASLLVSFFGLSRLSILIFMALFALANILILGSALVILSGKASKMVFDPEEKPFKFALLNSLALPLSFMLSMVSALPWFMAVPGYRYLLDRFVLSNFSIGQASFSFSRLVMLVVLFLLFRSLRGLASTSLTHMADKFSNLRVGFIPSIQTLLSYLIWCVFALIAMSFLGINITTLAVAATGLGVGIGLGLQNMIHNLVSGLVLILGGNVQIDNWVEVGGVSGKVVGMNIRCTVIETLENALLYIPNSQLIDGQFSNWTRNGPAINRKLTFRTVYGTDIDQARSVMLEAVSGIPHVAVDPATAVAVTDLSENCVILTLSVAIDDIDFGTSSQSKLREEIYRKFNENGIGFYVGSSLDVSLTEQTPAAKPEAAPGAAATTRKNEGQAS